MAIYTPLSFEEISDFLDFYDLGQLTSFEGIARGVSNTNYHVFTTKGRFILTIFEERRTRAKDLPFLFAWAAHLGLNGIKCPQAVPDKKGNVIHSLHGKPAVLVSFLDGHDMPRGETSAGHCRQMGAFTARLHAASADFTQNRENDWSLSRMEDILRRGAADIRTYNSGLPSLIEEEISWQAEHADSLSALPQAVVHTDLFPDNIFFQDGRIAAMIDFYFACTHALAYDLAIVANAWCFNSEGAFQAGRFRALMDGYESLRPLSRDERGLFQGLCRLASLRFLMSRLEEFLSHDPAQAAMTPYDPMEYAARLSFHKTKNIAAGS